MVYIIFRRCSYGCLISTLSFVLSNRKTSVTSGFVLPCIDLNPTNNPAGHVTAFGSSYPSHENLFVSSTNKKIYGTSFGQPRKKSTNIVPTCSSSCLQMFTGIVEEIGTVVDLVKKNDMTLWDGTISEGYELTVQSYVVLDETSYVGCSICVSGVCLTVTNLDRTKKQFQVGLAPETLKRTYFSTLHAGSLVNLERAALMGGRNSGHTVQGHVDCTGTILSKVYEGDSLVITIQVDDESVMPYIVPKGFIAIDGTSLTVIAVDASKLTFTFMLISYTQKLIIVPSKNINDKVNIEVDVLAKYASSILSASSTSVLNDTDDHFADSKTANTGVILSGLIQRIEELESKVKEMNQILQNTNAK